MEASISALLAPAAKAEFGILFVIVFAAFSVKSLTGFGNTLIVNGAFAFLKENRFTTPVELVWNLPANAWMVWKERGHLDLRLVVPVCVSVVFGEIVGTWLLAVGSDAALRTVLGLILIGLGLEMLLNRRTFKPNPWVGGAAALVSGILLGLFGIGAPIAAWFNKLADNKGRYRSNVCFIFLFDNLFRTAAYGVAGLLTPETLGFSLLLAPAVVLGMAAGRLIDKRMDAEAIRRLIVVLLLVTGATIAARYRFGL
jgi:uncharacterized membrane protein YfcA